MRQEHGHVPPRIVGASDEVRVDRIPQDGHGTCCRQGAEAEDKVNDGQYRWLSSVTCGTLVQSFPRLVLMMAVGAAVITLPVTQSNVSREIRVGKPGARPL